MGKFKENFKKNIKAYIITAIVAFVIGAIIFILYFFLTYKDLHSALNGVSIAGIALVGIGGLMWVAGEGTFDSMSYGFKQMFTSAFNKKANKYNDFYAYKEDKRIKRETAPKVFLSFFAAASLFILAIIVLEILYHVKLG